MSETRSCRRWWLALLVLYLLAAGCRGGWLVARYGSATGSAELAYPDERAYWLSARSLARGEGLTDEFGYRSTYMPGYPAFLSLFAGASDALGWARWAQALLGAWVAPATMLLARQWMHQRAAEGGGSGSGSMFVAGLAGLAAAFDPFLIFFAGLFLTETLFAALLVSAWAVVVRLCQARSAVSRPMVLLGGLLLLAMILLRPGAAGIVITAPVLILLAHYLGGPKRSPDAAIGEAADTASRHDAARHGAMRHGRSPAWGYAGLLIAVVVLGLLPWAVRNRQVTGHWIWLTTRGGISLYDGLQPGTAGESDLAHTKLDPGTADLTEIQWDRHWRREAWRHARSDPARVLKLAGLKFLRTWSLTPNVAEHSRGASAWISLVWMIVVLVPAIVGWLRVRRPIVPWIVLLAPVLIVTVQHMLFVGSVRYRVPVMPMMYVLSACGLAVLWKRCREVATGESLDRTDGRDPSERSENAG